MFGKRFRPRGFSAKATPMKTRSTRTFEDLPDRVVLGVLRKLPQSDLMQVARVSPRLHDLCLDSTLWSDLGVLGPNIPTEQACTLLRNAPGLKSLRLEGRADADTILLEASSYCRGLEGLELTRCRGSASYRQLAYLPLVRVAQRCRRLRRVSFRETDFMSSRVFKVWADLRSAEDPVLEIGVNYLTRRQATYLTSVLNGPPELLEHAMQGTPFVLLVENHSLSMQHVEVAGNNTCELVPVLVRLPTPLRVPTTTGSAGPSSAGCSEVHVDPSDDLDVVVAPPSVQDEDTADDDKRVSTPFVRLERLDYASVFGIHKPASEPINSWFRTGYMPECEPELQQHQH